MPCTTEQIRNLALAGHPGAGKTTLFEALLQAGGAVQVAGTIERGNTVSDFDPLEKERGHSLDATIASTDHAPDGQAPVHLNLIDTPGYPDFRGPALAAHVIADVFKIINDRFVGKLGIFRVYQGTVKKDTQLSVDASKKRFKVAHVFKLKGKEHVEIDQAIPGDIAAVAKIEDLHFGAVLHDSHDEDQIHLAPVDFPRPMFGLAVTAASTGQEQKLANALHKLTEEDPCFQVEHQTETNQTVIHGLSELHLRIVLRRLKDDYGVAVDTHPPRIAYRETISSNAEGHHRHKKQSGGAGQFGEVFLRIEPLSRGAGFEFVDAVKGGTIPRQFLPAVGKGVRQVLAAGAVAGYPMQDLRVIVYDGKHHPVDSKEVAFIAAGKKHRRR